MDNKKKPFSWEKAKAIDLVDYLENLGYLPQKINFPDYWYLSPLRTEKTASFKINRIENVWFDHGIGEGGNIIDLAIKLFDCTVKEFLEALSHDQQKIPSAIKVHTDLLPIEPSGIEILDTRPLLSRSLLHYLHERHIPLLVAQERCVEIHYQFKSRTYYSIGFRNDLGGYELRNAYWKNSSSPKGITTINNGSRDVALFEGFFDFLSFLVINKNQPQKEWNFCVLNSLSFFEKSRPFLEQHAAIHLFLDNDTAGQNCSQYALQISKKYVDDCALYKNYKDLNDWLVMMGKPIKQSISTGLSPGW